MAKKVFTGEKQNLAQLAEDVAAWLRQQGFEIQTGASPNAYLVQARKQSTLRSLLGNNQTIDVRIEGTPENYTINIDSGQWVKNLADSGPAAIAAAIATIWSLGLAAAWSASERSKIENGLWALKDASCPKCFRLGASTPAGEKVLRTENIHMLPSGDYKATRFFTDLFKCKFCAGVWERGERQRTVSLCPQCQQEGTRQATGERIIACAKTGQFNEQRQPLGKESYTNTFQCRSCGHAWDDGEKARLVEVCPHCEKASAAQHDHDEVVERYTDYETKLVEETHTRLATPEDGVAGLLTGEVVTGFTKKPVQVAVSMKVVVRWWKCKFCGGTWDTGKWRERG